MTYERPHVRSMQGYVPGFQPTAPAVKLNTNENPYPPSAEVMNRLATVSAKQLQRYPDPTAGKFRELRPACML